MAQKIQPPGIRLFGRLVFGVIAILILAAIVVFVAGVIFILAPLALFLLFPIGILLLVGAFLFFTFRIVSGRLGGRWRRPVYYYPYSSDSRKILRERYALGEISKEQFDEMMRDIQESE